MGEPHLVVDGSNIATEGRSLPSLQQLLESVDAIKKEFSYENVTVIVDATFGHRIDSSERDRYDEATSTGEIITPPAGVIGRGDAFILEVADRADAVVVSNDSFQEFHGKYTWLFDEGRLLGGKHVPGVGWIFLPRSPVRGPTSRKAVSDAKRKRRGSKQAASKAPAKSRGRSTKAASKPAPAKKKAPSSRASTERKSAGKEPEPYNEPLPFIEFVGAHPVGSVVEGEVEQFSSHGAYVMADGTRCYVSLKSIADPAPRSAREVLTLGETREWVVQAIDTPRRGIDLAVPGMERVGDEEADEEAEVEAEAAPADTEPPRRRRRSVKAEEMTQEPTPAPEPTPTPAREDAAAPEDKKLSVSQRRKLRAQQAAASEAGTEQATEPARETMAEKAPAKKAAAKKGTAKKSTAKTASAKKAPAKKSAAKKATAKKSTAKTASAKKAPAKKATAKKSAAKKATAKKSTAKTTSAKKAPAKKATAKKSAAKKAPAKKSAAKKAPAKKATAKKSTAKKATAKKSAAKKAPAKRKTSAKKTPAKKRSS